MQIDHYQIVEIIGRGDIATVYRAVDTLTGQTAALKMLRDDSPVVNARQFFENEADILARLDHSHIPAFYGTILGDRSAIICELIEGQDLEQRLAGCKEFFAESDVIGWAIQICDALAYLHTHPVTPLVFRDLKAAHIMVDSRGKAWLIDFNLAHALSPSGRLEQADRVGTKGFAAPEQYDGIVSPVSDIYALGTTLHYLLTRIDPRQERAFTFAPPRSVNPGLSKALAAVVVKASAFEPEDRFQSAVEMKTALMACRTGG